MSSYNIGVEKSIKNAIMYNDIHILIDIRKKHVIDYEYMKDMIKYNRYKMIKWFFQASRDNNKYMLWSLNIGNVKTIRFFYSKNVPIPPSALSIAILSCNEHLVKYLCSINKGVINKDLFEIYYNYDLEYFINIVYNYDIYYKIEKNTHDVSKIITGYLKDIRFNFNYEILEPIWWAIKGPLLLIAVKEWRFDIIDDIVTLKGMDEEDVTILLKILVYQDYENKMFFIQQLVNIEVSFIVKKAINQFFINNCLYQYIDYLDIETSLITNVYRCLQSNNKEPLSYGSWEEVLSDREADNIIYSSLNNHNYIISDILSFWKTGLNSYNYIIKPKFPRDPYNMKLFDPLEVYRIAYFASIYNVHIPLIVSFLLKKPTFFINCYIKFTTIYTTDDDRDEYLRKSLKNIGLKYTDGDSANNKPGYWILDKEVLTEYEISYYSYKQMNPLLIKLLFLRASLLLFKLNGVTDTIKSDRIYYSDEETIIEELDNYSEEDISTDMEDEIEFEEDIEEEYILSSVSDRLYDAEMYVDDANSIYSYDGSRL